MPLLVPQGTCPCTNNPSCPSLLPPLLARALLPLLHSLLFGHYTPLTSSQLSVAPSNYPLGMTEYPQVAFLALLAGPVEQEAVHVPPVAAL
jgi:hypothetical protein